MSDEPSGSGCWIAPSVLMGLAIWGLLIWGILKWAM